MPLPNNFNAILGAGLFGIVCAATLYVVEHIRAERRRHGMAKDLQRLNAELSDVRQEITHLLDLLNKQKKPRKTGRRDRKRAESAVSSNDDYTSALDSSDLEFYDLSDDETVLLSDLETTFGEIDAVLDAGDERELEECVERLRGLCLEHPEAPALLWRIAKAHYRLGECSEDDAAKQRHIKKGLEACEAALALDSGLADVHKWLAILIGSRTKFQPMKEKILDGFEVKRHVDMAIELSPEDPALHHMLGRFCLEVADLKWYERKIAATLFADPPNATYEEALGHFRNAEKYADYKWKENKLCIAKCRLQMGDYKGGLEELEEASTYDPNKTNDAEIGAEIASLLKKYSSYR